MSPGLHLGTPSLMFFTENFDALHSHLTSHNITVGEVVNMPPAEFSTLRIMKKLFCCHGK